MSALAIAGSCNYARPRASRNIPMCSCGSIRSAARSCGWRATTGTPSSRNVLKSSRPKRSTTVGSSNKCASKNCSPARTTCNRALIWKLRSRREQSVSKRKKVDRSVSCSMPTNAPSAPHLTSCDVAPNSPIARGPRLQFGRNCAGRGWRHQPARRRCRADSLNRAHSLV